MIKDVEKHLREAIKTSNRAFFNKYLEHEMTLTRNVIGQVLLSELVPGSEEWNSILQNTIAEYREKGYEEEQIYPGGTPWLFETGSLKTIAHQAIEETIIDKKLVEDALGIGSGGTVVGALNGFNPEVKKVNKFQISVTLHKGEFGKLKQTDKGKYINVVADALLKLYQNARSRAMDIIEVETIRAGHGTISGKRKKPTTDGEFIKNPPPGRTSQTKFNKSGRERGKLLRAHGRTKMQGGQLVQAGETQTTVAVLSVVKEWRKFTKGKIKTKVQKKKVLGMMGQVRKEITDALDVEFGIRNLTRDSTYGGIKSEQVIDIHVTDAKGNAVMASADKKEIEKFITAKAADIRDRLLKKYAHLEPDLSQSPTKRKRASALANTLLLERLLGIKGTRPDFRLRVNKKLLAQAKTLNKNTTQKGKGVQKGGNKKKTTVTTAQAVTAGKVKRHVQGSRSVDEARTLASPITLRNLLNEVLPETVAKNMGSPALNFRTGRFANSARVENVAIGPRGGLHIDYTYMRDPYETFEPGGKQGSSQRDPRRLIVGSIRELAVGILGKQPTTLRRT